MDDFEFHYPLSMSIFVPNHRRKKLWYAISVFLLLNHVFIANGSLLEEHTGVMKHDIMLSELSDNDPLGNDEELSVVLLGNRFKCKLPPKDFPVSSNTEKFNLADIRVVRNRFATAPCILNKDSYWSYSICVGRTVYQFHKDTVYKLGSYRRSTRPMRGVISKDKILYFSQSYTGGSRCDITGKRRTTEVRFFCAKERDRIHSIQERASCVYLFEVYTSRACLGSKTANARVTYCSPESDLDFAEVFGWYGKPSEKFGSDRKFQELSRVEELKNTKYLHFMKSASGNATHRKQYEGVGRSDFLRSLKERHSAHYAVNLLKVTYEAEYYFSEDYSDSIVQETKEVVEGSEDESNYQVLMWQERNQHMLDFIREFVKKVDIGKGVLKQLQLVLHRDKKNYVQYANIQAYVENDQEDTVFKRKTSKKSTMDGEKV